MPNPPYAPKTGKLSVEYIAKWSIDFNATDSDSDYPFQYYHYSPFAVYQVYDSEKSFAENSTEPIDLFSGFKADGAIYIALEKVQAPCVLSLYFEQAEQIESRKTEERSITYKYLAESGWKELELLKDATSELTCSGIILFHIPEDISSSNAMMPDKKKYWISIRLNEQDQEEKDRKEESQCDAQKTESFAKTVCLNTQAIKAKRADARSSAIGKRPTLKENQIASTVEKIQEIEKIEQPFPSFNGQAAEDQTSFYHRVSTRIRTKDRSSSKRDYEQMAFEAYPDLYYAKLVTNPSSPGDIGLGLVQRYSDPNNPSALRPVVNTRDKALIEKYLATKTSPFVSLNLFNMKHQEVMIKCCLRIITPGNEGLLSKKINEELKIFLSPWIKSDQRQIRIDQGIQRAEIVDFIQRFPDVEEVSWLDVCLDPKPFDYTESPCGETTLLVPPLSGDPVFPNDEKTLFVSALTHNIQAWVLK